MATDWLTAGEARARLGVQAQTLYAYVSRGLIRSERVAGVAVEPVFAHRRRAPGRARAAARRARPGPRSSSTRRSPSSTPPDGWRTAAGTSPTPRSRRRTKRWPSGCGRPTRTTQEWVAPEDQPAASRRTRAVRPARATPRFPTGCASRPPRSARCDPLRNDRRRPSGRRARSCAHRDAGREPAARRRRPRRRPRGSIAARFWPRLSPLTATAARVEALDHAMVLLADHELAASTLAVRVAASTWADPYLLVCAGLAAAGGPLHGGASEAVRTLLREVIGGTERGVGRRRAPARRATRSPDSATPCTRAPIHARRRCSPRCGRRAHRVP